MKRLLLAASFLLACTTNCMENGTQPESSRLADFLEKAKDTSASFAHTSLETAKSIPNEYYIKGACGVGAILGCRFALHRFQQTQFGSWLTGSRNVHAEIDNLRNQLERQIELTTELSNKLDRTAGQQEETNRQTAELQRRFGAVEEQTGIHTRQIEQLFTTTGSQDGRLKIVEKRSEDNKRRLDEQNAYGQIAELMQAFGRGAEERGQLVGRIERLETDMRGRANLIGFTMVGARLPTISSSREGASATRQIGDATTRSEEVD